MIVGACTVEIRMFGSNSLKEKRHILKSLIGRIQSRFNVSIAEVDQHDQWRNAVIGFACVSNTTKHANQMVDNVIKFMEGDDRIEILNCDIEIL